MASNVVTPNRLKLASMALLGATALLVLGHVIVAGGGGFQKQVGSQVFADGDHGFVSVTGAWEEGDTVGVTWYAGFGAYQPIFNGGDFYAVAGQVGPGFDRESENVLAHKESVECCGAKLYFEVPAEGLSFVWDLNYAADFTPSQPVPTDREVAYIEQFLQKQSPRFEVYYISIEDAAMHAKLVPYIVVEIILVAGAVVLWALSFKKVDGNMAEGRVERVVELMQKGRDHLHAQLRLYVLSGPALILAGVFGVEAIDGGTFGHMQTAYFYTVWTEWAVALLWLAAASFWILGFIRVILALRHYSRTQPPELGELSA